MLNVLIAKNKNIQERENVTELKLLNFLSTTVTELLILD